MLKALIIDDEQRAADILQLMIERFVPEIERVWTCTDARQAAQAIHAHQPDLLFLDIRMPYLSGFDVLEQIPHQRFRIIFTTAYEEYTLQAIRFSAFDYLLKPVDVQELIQAVQRYRATIDELAFLPAQLRNVHANLRTGEVDQFRLAVPTRDGIHFFYPQEIVRLEAQGAYTEIRLRDRRLLVSRSLGEYEELLTPHGFIRTHKSHLVNRLYVSYYDHEGFVVLRDDTRIEVSRRRKDDVLQSMKK